MKLKIGQKIELIGGPFDGERVPYGGGKEIVRRYAKTRWVGPSGWCDAVYVFEVRGKRIVARHKETRWSFPNMPRKKSC